MVPVYHYSSMYSAAYQYSSMWTPQLFPEHVSSGISSLLLWTSQVDVMSSLMPLAILFLKILEQLLPVHAKITSHFYGLKKTFT